MPPDRARTALAARTAQGAKLGNRTNPGQAHAKGATANRAGAGAFAANVSPVVRPIHASGATTLRAIAEALNARCIRTARGGAWYAAIIATLLARSE